jgi:hypothetical protein
VALFFAQAGFQLYGASLPLYFATLQFDPTLIGLLIGTAGVAELVGALALARAEPDAERASEMLRRSRERVLARFGLSQN